MNRDNVLSRLNAMLHPSCRKRLSSDPVEVNSPLSVIPRIFCVDGFSMSVQASWGHYCTPRDSVGPWDEVEVGFPSTPEAALMPYIDGSDSDPTETVYGFVPIGIVADIIMSHGGIAKPER